MANTLKRVQASTTIAGTILLTVPVSTTITIIGCRGSNKTASATTFEVTINGFYVSAQDTPLAIGSAIDIMVGSKIVCEAGDVIRVFSSVDDSVDVHLSYLSQTA